jgi:hypothetical protein
VFDGIISRADAFNFLVTQPWAGFKVQTCSHVVSHLDRTECDMVQGRSTALRDIDQLLSKALDRWTQDRHAFGTTGCKPNIHIRFVYKQSIKG